MKKIINYEKDIQFNTAIGEICSISLEHDFTVDDRVLKGEFIIEGDYKPNTLSINKEAFSYHLPLEYELEDTCDIESLNYDIDNFEYNVSKDKLEIYIDFKVQYEEKAITPVIPDITEEEINSDIIEETPSRLSEMDIEIPLNRVEKEIEIVEDETSSEVEIIDEEFKIEDDEEILEERLDDDEQELILDSSLETDEYITYHVHIIREGETLETIAAKYGTTIEVIKEYNNCESLEIKAKLIIPSNQDE